jgi:hypothetical protein
LPIRIELVNSVGQQAAHFSEDSARIDGREAGASCQRCDLCTMNVREAIRHHDQATIRLACLCGNDRFELGQVVQHELFDHLVGEGEQLVGHGKAERLCGLEVDHQLELDWGLDGKLARFRALKDAIGARTGAAIASTATDEAAALMGFRKDSAYGVDAGLNSIATLEHPAQSP